MASLIINNINHQINQKMNKLLVIYGSLLMSSSPIADAQESTVPVFQVSHETTRSLENSFAALRVEADVVEIASFYDIFSYEDDFYELNLNEIEFVEEESELDLGFETSDYLPEGFNPYESFFDLNSIIYIENESDFDLGFDTSEYLPKGFDPYSSNFEINTINYMEDESVLLDFDTSDYLPKDFDPYKMYFDVNSVIYIDFEELEWEFGFDTKAYLPVDFDPYANTMAISTVNCIEDDEIDLGFDTSMYLSKDFDPYAGSN